MTAPERTGPAPADQTVWAVPTLQSGQRYGAQSGDVTERTKRLLAATVRDQTAPDRTGQTGPDQTEQTEQAAPVRWRWFGWFGWFRRADRSASEPPRAAAPHAVRGAHPRRDVEPKGPPRLPLTARVFSLALIGVIAGAFKLAWANVHDYAKRVLHVQPEDAWLAPTVLGLTTICAVIATIWLRNAPWRVRAYAWGIFALSLAAEVVAGVSHAKYHNLPPEAGVYSGLWPLMVAGVTHLAVVMYRHVFDPMMRGVDLAARPAREEETRQSKQAAAPTAAPSLTQTESKRHWWQRTRSGRRGPDQTRQTEPADQTEQTPPVQTSPVEADQTPDREQTAPSAVRRTAKPRTGRTKGRPKPRTAKQSAAGSPANVRPLDAHRYADETAAVRAEMERRKVTGLPTYKLVQTAVASMTADGTCGREKAKKVRLLMAAELGQERAAALA